MLPRDSAQPPPGIGPVPGADTRQRLLDAAERLFAERSYEATSLRQVTAAAGANLAAVNYHFGSKQGLFRAVFLRRIEPINTERMGRLAALEAREVAGQPVVLEELLRALMEPALDLARQEDGRWFARLVGRAFSEPGEHWSAVDAEFHEVRSAFVRAFARSLPHLRPTTLGWRLFFALGVQCVLLAGASQHQRITGGLAEDLAPEVLLDELVAFAAAGLRAPAGEQGT